MRISDWSSDVCSSDLDVPVGRAADAGDLAILNDVDAARGGGPRVTPGNRIVPRRAAAPLQRGAHDRIASTLRDVERRAVFFRLLRRQIGRASCRVRVCQYV